MMDDELPIWVYGLIVCGVISLGYLVALSVLSWSEVFAVLSGSGG